MEDAGDISLEDLIQNEEVVVTVSRGGYMKRTSLDTYRRQTRGGKGRIGMVTRSEDVVEHLMVAMTHSYMLIFTNKGRLYWLKIYNIPDAGSAGKGKNINGLIASGRKYGALGVLAALYLPIWQALSLPFLWHTCFSEKADETYLSV